MQDPAMRQAIAALGNELGPDTLPAVVALFDEEQRAKATACPAVAVDMAYGPDDRHRLDIYAPSGASDRPVLLFVHGGGFLRGDKGDGGAWQNANVCQSASKRDPLSARKRDPLSGWRNIDVTLFLALRAA